MKNLYSYKQYSNKQIHLYITCKFILNNMNNGLKSPKIQFTYLLNKQTVKLPDSMRVYLRRSASEKEVGNFDLENIIIRSTMTGSTCSLCETRYKFEQMSSITNSCEHSFCKNCLHSYIIYKINVMEEIYCPQEGCSQTIRTESQAFLDIPEQYKIKYGKFQLWKQTINNPNLKLCPTENCKGIIDTRQSFACKTCKTEFCLECMLKKHEGPCDVNFQLNFKDWKRCPSCNMFIQKNDGCNHITCRCNHQFCYVCLSNWDEDHYSCGQNGNVGQGGPYYQYFLPPVVQDLSRCKKITLGIIMLIFFPIVLLLVFAIFLLCLVIGSSLALVIGPCIIASNTYISQCCPIWSIIMLVGLPLAMAFSFIFAAGAILYNGTPLALALLKSYSSTMSFLICRSQQPQPQLVLQYNDF